MTVFTLGSSCGTLLFGWARAYSILALAGAKQHATHLCALVELDEVLSVTADDLTGSVQHPAFHAESKEGHSPLGL